MAKRAMVGRSSVAAVAVGVLVAAGCGGSSETKDKDGAAGRTGDGTAGSGGSNAGGGKSATGGKAGGVTSASGGTGQAGGGQQQAGGSGAESGGASAGGGTGSDTGGASPGTGGTTLPEPEVGTVGTECSEPGALSCAGTHQRVVVTCNGDGEWEAFETCPVGQFCDTRPGSTLGSCQEPHPDCVEREPGALLCQGNDVYACGVDTTSTELVEDCPLFCADSECVDSEPCPTGNNWVNCAEDCGGEHLCELSSTCIFDLSTQGWSSIEALRTPSAETARCSCVSGRRHVTIGDSLYSTDLKITVSAPWWVILTDKPDGACREQPGGQCLLATGAESRRFIVIGTDDPTAPSVNARFQILDEPGEASCP